MNLKKILYTIILVFIWVNICNAESPQSSYINWLQKNNAWEVLNHKLQSLSPSEENILTRANYLQRMNNPGKSLEILQEHGRFSSNSTEADRRLLMAGIYRQSRDHYLALENYASAGALLSTSKYREKLQNKPNIHWYFKTVWKRNFWNNSAKYTLNSTSSPVLFQTAKLAKNIRPENDFWRHIDNTLLKDKSATASGSGSSESKLKISSDTRNRTVQALLAAAAGNTGKGNRLLQSIEQKEIRQMWGKVLSKIFNQELFNPSPENTHKDLDITYPKYRAFKEYICPVLESQAQDSWSVQQPQIPSWRNFISSVNSLDPANALEKIKNELDSSLLNKNLNKALKKYGFIYALLAQDYPEARNLWRQIEKDGKCLSLELAGYILGYSPSFSHGKDSDKFQYPYLNQLSLILKNSLYSASGSKLYTPFWIREFNNGDSGTAKAVDLLFNYSFHKHQWSKDQSEQLAKTISLLYPNSSAKNQACIWLAKRAHENGNTNKAWKYLQEIENSIRTQEIQGEYLRAKAGLLMELGNKEKSLHTYQKLLAEDPQGIPAQKKLNLAILSQKLGKWEWAQNTLQGLWKNREELSAESQAETLFWLGEGAQNNGNKQMAKDYYFRLAWKYPKHNMWALTALHRAAMICKKQGQLFTAKNILQKVQKEAVKESQKKQAKKELSSIREQIREQQQATGSLLY